MAVILESKNPTLPKVRKLLTGLTDTEFLELVEDQMIRRKIMWASICSDDIDNWIENMGFPAMSDKEREDLFEKNECFTNYAQSPYYNFTSELITDLVEDNDLVNPLRLLGFKPAEESIVKDAFYNSDQGKGQRIRSFWDEEGDFVIYTFEDNRYKVTRTDQGALSFVKI